jgi:hypothetical protein
MHVPAHSLVILSGTASPFPEMQTRFRAMKHHTAPSLVALAAAIMVFGGSAAPSFSANTAPKDEEEVILEDAKKNYPVTPAEMEECMKDWDPQNEQMAKEEWKDSCERTLKYAPEEDSGD